MLLILQISQLQLWNEFSFWEPWPWYNLKVKMCTNHEICLFKWSTDALKNPTNCISGLNMWKKILKSTCYHIKMEKKHLKLDRNLRWKLWFILLILSVKGSSVQQQYEEDNNQRWQDNCFFSSVCTLTPRWMLRASVSKT